MKFTEEELVNEVWKQIEDFPNYEVSSLGRVRNRVTKYIIAQLKNRDDYMTVRLRKKSGDNEKPCSTVHRLVAKAFLPNPENKPQVNHINGEKYDNRLVNLEWATREENMQHAMRLGLFKPEAPEPPLKRKVRIVETGEVFDNLVACASAIGGQEQNVSGCLNGKHSTHKELHFEEISDEEYEKICSKKNKQDFLYPHQKEALKKMFNGCLLNGGTGSGKSRTGIYYFFSKNGGSIENQVYKPMRPIPPDLYILTTAKKRNDKEWEEELVPFLLYPNPKTKRTERYGNKVIIDSWQNIKKYTDVTGAQFIFDENKISGKGVWAKAFLKITKNNEWIILSATNGDKWEDYETVFVAHNFFRNRTEFRDEHLVYSNYAKYPDVIGYRNERRLTRLRDRLLIDMDFNRHTRQIHEDVYCQYDIPKYKDAIRKRWDPYKNEPISQPSGLCYVLRHIVNEDQSRQVRLLELLEDHPRAIIFYNFDFELEILLSLGYQVGTKVAQYNGHQHDKIPDGDRWVYLVQYTSGCEAWNTISTDTIIFYSQNYSYKVLKQASGRIDRLTTPYTDLHYYHLKSRSGIDLAISKALKEKKKFNERKWCKWD